MIKMKDEVYTMPTVYCRLRISEHLMEFMSKFLGNCLCLNVYESRKREHFFTRSNFLIF